MPINHQIQLRSPIHFCTHPWHHDQQKTGRASFCAIRIVLQGPSISTRSRELVAPQSPPAVLTGTRVGFSPGTRTEPGELARPWEVARRKHAVHAHDPLELQVA